MNRPHIPPAGTDLYKKAQLREMIREITHRLQSHDLQHEHALTLQLELCLATRQLRKHERSLLFTDVNLP